MSRKAFADPGALALPYFDVGALQRIAGAKVFGRGRDYVGDGSVSITTLEPSRVVARVVGTHPYRAELTGSGKSFEGSCSCPANSDWGFCKHLVAVALTVNELPPGALADAAARIDRVRAHLTRLGVDALVDLILRRAEDDEDLRRELDEALVVDEDDDDLMFRHFQTAILDALERTGEGDRWDDDPAPQAASQLNRTLDGLAKLIGRGKAGLVIRLLDRLFEGADDALERDNDGELMGACERAVELHLAACAAAKPDPLELARELFTRETQSGWDLFAAADDRYAKTLGNKGLAEFRRLAEDAFAASSRRANSGKDAKMDDAPAVDHAQLRRMLERFAERDGNVDGVIALRAEALDNAYAYLELAEYCQRKGRAAEALKWAEEGAWRHEEQAHRGLNAFLAERLAEAGRRGEALDLLWRDLARAPNRPTYDLIKKVAGAKPGDRSVFDRAAAVLVETGDKPRGAYWLAWQDCLIDFAMSEKLFDEAWASVNNHGCSPTTRAALAKATQRSHPAEALASWLKDVEDSLRSAAGSYDDIVAIIERIEAIRAAMGEQAAHGVYVAKLMAQHKMKRNFIKAMKEKGYGAG